MPSAIIRWNDVMFGFILLWIPLALLPAQNRSSESYYLNITSSDQIHAYFSYAENGRPLISGHRGGMVAGMPENSIEAMEFTLQHTPAFFEIDPRLSKDSVIVLVHDATLDRTTTGTGKVSDYTLKELKALRLKDKFGQVTDFQIPTLEEAILWAKGKTILNLDKKDVPLEMTTEIIKGMDAAGHVMVTVHTAEQAAFYLRHIPNIIFSAFVKTEEAFDTYVQAGIPWSQVMAYVGSKWDKNNIALYEKLHAAGVRYMISTAPSSDHLKSPEARAEAYRSIISSGADVIESDMPVEVAKAIKDL